MGLSDANLLVSLLLQRQQSVFAVLDGAKVSGLPYRLKHFRVQHACLLRGRLTTEMALVAPYLVRLELNCKFTHWLLRFTGVSSEFIYCFGAVEFRALRTHLRSLTTVRHPLGRFLFFRFYDPTVLASFLPLCDGSQMAVMFGPLQHYYVLHEEAGYVEEFALMGTELMRRRLYQEQGRLQYA